MFLSWDWYSALWSKKLVEGANKYCHLQLAILDVSSATAQNHKDYSCGETVQDTDALSDTDTYKAGLPISWCVWQPFWMAWNLINSIGALDKGDISISNS